MTGTTTGRVLVGYDGTEAARAAVRWAAAEAARRGVPLAVAFAADYTGLVGGPFGSAWLPDTVIDAAQSRAEEGVGLARAGQPGLEVTAHAYAGPPAEMLIRESRYSALVVIGTRGLGELGACVHGSVGMRLAARALCPVVVVRGAGDVAPDADHPVVVGVDGSPTAGAALEFAVAAARETGAPLTVVCAWPGVTEEWTRAYWLAADPASDPDKTSREAGERVAAEAGERARELAPGLAVEVHARSGRPAQVLLEVAGPGAGLVVVGSRGRGSVRGLLLGSVSHDVVHGASFPVAVVRDGGTDPAESESVDTTASV